MRGTQLFFGLSRRNLKEKVSGRSCPYATKHWFGLVLKKSLPWYFDRQKEILNKKIELRHALVTESFSENLLIAISSTCSICINDFRQPEKSANNNFFSVSAKRQFFAVT
jgi:hypothetical protein